MKRLIRRSEIYDGFNRGNEYWEAFKNPSSKEIGEVKKMDPNKGVRGVIYEDGTVIIWPAEIEHRQIHKYINDVDIDEFRFAYDPNYDWIIDAHNRWTIEETRDLILKYENILSQYGDTNGTFGIYFAKVSDLGDYEDITIDVIKRLKEENKTTQEKTEEERVKDDYQSQYNYNYAKRAKLIKNKRGV